MNETLLSRSGNVQELSFFHFFLKETSEQQEGRLLAVVTFLFIFFRRVLSLAESFPGMITINIEQHV